MGYYTSSLESIIKQDALHLMKGILHLSIRHFLHPSKEFCIYKPNVIKCHKNNLWQSPANKITKNSWRNTKDDSRKEENVSTQTTLDATPLLKWKFRRQPRKSIIIRTWNHKPEFVKRVFWEWSFPSIFIVDFLWILHSFVSYLHWKGVISGNRWDDRTIW